VTKPGVGITEDSLVIIVQIKERADNLTDHQPLGKEDKRPGQQEPEHIERGENAESPAKIKEPERNLSKAFFFLQKQPSDEEPAQNEKHQDSSATVNSRYVHVVENHQ
jgi:hypothetical protein